MNISIEKILKEVQKNRPQANLELIKRAYDFAEKAHRGQKRSSGEDYINHSLATAYTLSQIGLDEITIAAALLHDVADDTPFALKDIRSEFGKEITFLVKGVTKLGKIKYRGVQRQIENLRKMFLAMAEDIRVVLIKLADRLHNMQTLGDLPERKQQRIALETLDIYAPLASRLGIGHLSGTLQDLSFPYVFQDEYNWLIKNVKEKYQERENYLKKVKPFLEKELEKEGIKPIEIHSRAKHHLSLYQKLLRNDMDFEKIYDLIAMRIIVKDIKECYGALGVIHKNWKPLPGRIKDYISMPKPNGYQSLHTTVFCVNGKITEFQIRTPEMHRHAEYGIAAHWAYSEKEKPDEGVRLDEKRFAWVAQLRDWQKKIGSSTEFLDSLKIDFFKNRIFVLTPKGEVIDLPEDATSVDFAYAIHTEVGHQCSGAKINGKMVSLDTPLKSGDVVEILTQKNKKPSEKWLEFVKTNYAKDKIKSVVKERTRMEVFPKKLEAQIKITVEDRVGLLKDVSTTISSLGINITEISSSIKSEPATITALIELKDRPQLYKLVTKLKTVEGVKELSHKII